ncbi:MAG TPA: bis(5'-nucleosyl)-tetraphosphatase (symmetrical) YqeK [Bacilli bacterium]|nr:MAG: putative nicotinate-nucleotide adenylyltransferase [Tenericutes bacterium ADurb.BinA124]HNZ50902.1 bis(5'-nucleosyl)-tetraphosphatase (symmetrical) YqeK [Bacilli bacterium]HPN60830.1 bis(5'-nucleosyl)-tetraphosphatase (symmetrical) YqeK [Bacilli bacterium]HPX84865.1 bis(5'-nucleosyl)-tetraphosphatase (symmetrical) YqeK [Bacilli bacterium]HQC75059.1 bis(5'-nucleosyl)-tetraphosphatase (symmetrical) YqeK [Bacilli bacterium]
MFLRITLKKRLWNKYRQSKHPDIYERYQHSLAVLKKALEIRKTFKLPVMKSQVIAASLLHDYAKFVSREEFSRIIEKYQLDSSILELSPQLWHAFLGPYVVHEELGITDVEVLDAIRYHTTGNLNMTLLGEIIFLADYTDDTRIEEYFQEAKALSKVNFYGAIAQKIKQIIASNHHEISQELRLMYEKYRRLDGSNFNH